MKKQSLKKSLSIIICISVMLAAMPFGAITAGAETSGTTGACTWTLNGTALTVSGSGAMGDYSITYNSLGRLITTAPWGGGITEVNIGNSVTNIGNWAFSGCTGLTSVTIPNSVISIEDAAFFDCTGLTSVTIPNSVASIGDGAFEGCTGLTSVTIPNSVTSIGDGAFLGCTGLESIAVDINNPKYHSAGNCIIETASKTLIFGYKNSIIPSDGSVTSIGGWAFSGCTGLANITIPNSVTSIGECAFYGCTGLTSVTIENSVTSIRDYAFYGCTGLKTVIYYGTDEQWKKISIGSHNSELTQANRSYQIYHVFDNVCDTTCNICGYVRTAPHQYKTVLSNNVSQHWYECEICGAKTNNENHIFVYSDGYTCNKCGYHCEMILGDVNLDGEVNSADAIWLLRHTLFPSKYAVTQATDYNDDNNEDSADAIWLLRHTLFPNKYILAIRYVVTWKNYDGTTLFTDKVKGDTTPSYSHQSPTRSNDSLYSYSFNGWSPAITTLTDNATYYAKYAAKELNSFTVKYNANGGTGAPISQTKTKGQNITLSSIKPTNGNRAFVGWRCDYNNLTYLSGATFDTDANVTLYAVWGHNCSTCSGTGTHYQSFSCPYCNGSGHTSSGGLGQTFCSDCHGTGEVTVSGPTACSSCGGFGGIYRYACSCGRTWYSNVYGRKCPGCGKSSTNGTKLSDCTTCKGKGTVTASYTQTCTTCKGTGRVNKNQTTNCSYCSGTGRMTSNVCETCLGNKVIVDEQSKYTVTLDYDNTTSTASVEYGSPYKLKVPTKQGYSFIGWYDSSVGGKQYTDSCGVSLNVWDISGNKRLYAHWALN